MQRKNGLDIRNQQENRFQNDDLFFLGFGKVLKMQASVINEDWFNAKKAHSLMKEKSYHFSVYFSS